MRFKYLPFKRQPHKMVKHTQTIRQLLPTNVLSVSDSFVGLVLKGLMFQFYHYFVLSHKTFVDNFQFSKLSECR